jgi:hypothetical protein
MSEEGMTKDADLASIIGVERSIIPKVRTAKQSASIELIVKTFIAYPKINTDYILTGRGSMFIQEQGTDEDTIRELKELLGEATMEIKRLREENELLRNAFTKLQTS